MKANEKKRTAVATVDDVFFHSPTPPPSKRTKFSSIDGSTLSESHDFKLARLIQWEYILAHTRRLHAQETLLAEQQIKQVFNLVQHKKRRRKDGYLALHWESQEEALELFKEVSSEMELLSLQFLAFRESHLNLIHSLEQSLQQLEYKHSLFSNFDLFCAFLESFMTKLHQILSQLDQEKVNDITEKVNVLVSNIRALQEFKEKEKKLNHELSFRRGLSRCMEWLANPYKQEWHLTASEAFDE